MNMNIEVENRFIRSALRARPRFRRDDGYNKVHVFEVLPKQVPSKHKAKFILKVYFN